ncbi:hypothetical protein F4678DRAFT_269894 [Xylaria arbuscula]|nr:hypothetical protein F4678DRAFT_269894 [Xylaria arbuscula]
MERCPISGAFTDMFQVAGSIVHNGHWWGFDLWDILPLVQGEINWAQELPEAVFFELFTCLVEARHEWLKTLPSPPRPRYFNRFIHQMDIFRRRVGDCRCAEDYHKGEPVSWILVDAVFFNELASGLELDDDEEYDDNETTERLLYR